MTEFKEATDLRTVQKVGVFENLFIKEVQEHNNYAVTQSFILDLDQNFLVSSKISWFLNQKEYIDNILN
jgi:hypothetical protein